MCKTLVFLCLGQEIINKEGGKRKMHFILQRTGYFLFHVIDKLMGYDMVESFESKCRNTETLLSQACECYYE